MTETPKAMEHLKATECSSLREGPKEVAKNSSVYVRRSKLPLQQKYSYYMGGYVYIMCSLNHSTLYVGVSSNLPLRVLQHKEKTHPNSFTARYNCVKLVYCNKFDTIMEAIAEEKRIKGGSRKNKELLIISMNPEWKDLYEKISQ
jgi:putative endonuclease